MGSLFGKSVYISWASSHVAGIAALYAQSTRLRGRELCSILTQSALRLDLPSRDVGIGLAKAPVK